MSIFTNMKTKYKLLFSFSISFLVLFIVTILFIGFFMGKSLKELQLHNTEIIVNNARDMLNQSIESTIKNYLRGIAEKNYDIVKKHHDMFKQGLLKEEEALKAVREILLSQKIGVTGYVAGVSSKGVLVIHPVSQGVDASGFDFMQKAMSMKNGYLEYDWKNKGETEARSKVGYMRYFEPWDIIIWISSYKSEFVDLIKPEDFERELLDIKIGQTGYMIVFNEKGKTIIHPELKNVNLLEMETENNTDFVSEVIENEKGTLTYNWKGKDDKKMREKILYYNYISDLNWYICGGTYVDELTVEANRIMRLMLIFLFIGVFLFIGISYLISGFLTKPINNAINSIQYIITENDLTEQLQVYSKDEIGRLTNSFNSFIVRVQDVMIQVKNSSLKINNLVQSLFSSVQEAFSTANQQAAAVKEIVSTMEDADSLAKSIGSKINEVTTTTENTRDIVQSGFVKVKESQAKMIEINESNQSTIEGIKYLNEKINNIWDIVNMINGIADQTKIIAFNAELEAAAAGEAGKNFRIVATEIRRLADNTVTSTSEIKEKITEIQKSSDRLLLTSENGTERIKEGNDLSAEINTSFSEILNSAEASSDSTKQISVSIKQQISSFEQIVIALKQISEGVDNAAEATRETSNVADNLQELVDILNEILTGYRIENTDQNQF